MCVILVKPAGVKMPGLDTLEKMWNTNRDGAGLAISNKKHVHIAKGFMTFEALKDYYTRMELDKLDYKLIAMHFRIGTHGLKDGGNTHPFPVSTSVQELRALEATCESAVFHNGIFRLSVTADHVSDTGQFIIDAATEHATLPGHDGIVKYWDAQSTVVGASKLCVVRPSGHYTVRGDWSYSPKAEGCLVSNTGWASSYSYTPAKTTKSYGRGYWDEAWGEQDYHGSCTPGYGTHTPPSPIQKTTYDTIKELTKKYLVDKSSIWDGPAHCRPRGDESLVLPKKMRNRIRFVLSRVDTSKTYDMVSFPHNIPAKHFTVTTCGDNVELKFSEQKFLDWVKEEFSVNENFAKRAVATVRDLMRISAIEKAKKEASKQTGVVPGAEAAPIESNVDHVTETEEDKVPETAPETAPETTSETALVKADEVTIAGFPKSKLSDLIADFARTIDYTLDDEVEYMQIPADLRAMFSWEKIAKYKLNHHFILNMVSLATAISYKDLMDMWPIIKLQFNSWVEEGKAERAKKAAEAKVKEAKAEAAKAEDAKAEGTDNGIIPLELAGRMTSAEVGFLAEAGAELMSSSPGQYHCLTENYSFDCRPYSANIFDDFMNRDAVLDASRAKHPADLQENGYGVAECLPLRLAEQYLNTFIDEDQQLLGYCYLYDIRSGMLVFDEAEYNIQYEVAEEAKQEEAALRADEEAAAREEAKAILAEKKWKDENASKAKTQPIGFEWHWGND